MAEAPLAEGLVDDVVDDPRLEVTTAYVDSRTKALEVSAYMDLKAHYANEGPLEMHPLPHQPGVRMEEKDTVQGLRWWSDAKGAGWISYRDAQNGVKKQSRWFSKHKLGSWRLAFLLARLQRNVWLADQQAATAPQEDVRASEAPVERSRSRGRGKACAPAESVECATPTRGRGRGRGRGRSCSVPASARADASEAAHTHTSAGAHSILVVAGADTTSALSDIKTHGRRGVAPVGQQTKPLALLDKDAVTATAPSPTAAKPAEKRMRISGKKKRDTENLDVHVGDTSAPEPVTVSGKKKTDTCAGDTSSSDPVADSSALGQTWEDFTPKDVDLRRCLARTWNKGCGGQCHESRVPGADLCGLHDNEASSPGGLTYGFVDGPIPEMMLAKFRRTAEKRSKESLADEFRKAVSEHKKRLRSRETASRIDERTQQLTRKPPDRTSSKSSLMPKEQRELQQDRQRHEPRGNGRRRLNSTDRSADPQTDALSQKLADDLDAAIEESRREMGNVALGDILDRKGAVKPGSMKSAISYVSMLPISDTQGKLAILHSIRLTMTRETEQARAFVAANGVSALKQSLEAALPVLSKAECGPNPTDLERVAHEGLEILSLAPMTFQTLVRTTITATVAALGRQCKSVKRPATELTAKWKREFSTEIHDMKERRRAKTEVNVQQKQHNGKETSASPSSTSSSPTPASPIGVPSVGEAQAGEAVKTTLSQALSPVTTSSSGGAGDDESLIITDDRLEVTLQPQGTQLHKSHSVTQASHGGNERHVNTIDGASKAIQHPQITASQLLCAAPVPNSSEKSDEKSPTTTDDVPEAILSVEAKVSPTPPAVTTSPSGRTGNDTTPAGTNDVAGGTQEPQMSVSQTAAPATRSASVGVEALSATADTLEATQDPQTTASHTSHSATTSASGGMDNGRTLFTTADASEARLDPQTTVSQSSPSAATPASGGAGNDNRLIDSTTDVTEGNEDHQTKASQTPISATTSTSGGTDKGESLTTADDAPETSQEPQTTPSQSPVSATITACGGFEIDKSLTTTADAPEATQAPRTAASQTPLLATTSLNVGVGNDKSLITTADTPNADTPEATHVPQATKMLQTPPLAITSSGGNTSNDKSSVQSVSSSASLTPAAPLELISALDPAQERQEREISATIQELLRLGEVLENGSKRSACAPAIDVELPEAEPSNDGGMTTRVAATEGSTALPDSLIDDLMKLSDM